MSKSINARDIQVGDRILTYPPLSETFGVTDAHGEVTHVTTSWGVTTVWVETENDGRRSDLILNHSDPVTVERFVQCSADAGGDPASGCDNEAESGTDTCVEHRLAYEALCDPALEPTLDGYEVEFVDVICVNPDYISGLDSDGNIVRFRNAEDATSATILAALRHGSDLTVKVASCSVISREPAFEVV